MKLRIVHAAVLLTILTGYSMADPEYGNIREVDFNNFTYRYQGQEFQVINGEYIGAHSKNNPPESFIVVAIQYGDLTGDGKEESVILTEYNGGGSGSFESFYIYTLRGGQVILLDQIEGGDRASDGNKAFYIKEGNLYLINYDSGQNICNACYEWERTHMLKWNGSKFIEIWKSEPHPVPESEPTLEDTEESNDPDQILEEIEVVQQAALNPESERETGNVHSLVTKKIDAIGNPHFVNLLIKTLNNKDKNSNIRSGAALVLANLKDQRALEPLIGALKDKNSSVRGNAALALGEFESSLAISPLISLLQDVDIHVRMNTIWALGEIRNVQAVEPIIRVTKQALRCQEWKVVTEGIEALGKIKDSRSMGFLLGMLEAKDADIRTATVWALGEVGNEDAIIHLKRALSVEIKEYVKSDIDAALTKLESKHGLRISELNN